MSSERDPLVSERERQHEFSRLQRVGFRGRPRSSAGSVLLGLLLFFALGVAAVVLILRSAGQDGLGGRLASVLMRGSTSVNSSASAVVDRIQRLNRLETVSYSVDTVVEGKHQNAVLPDLLFGDRLLLVVHGRVIAGVDLTELKPESVHISGKSVTLDLPASKVFTTAIDNTKSRVFARSTGVLVPADPNLETDTRRQAENQILQAALSDGILDTARANARGSIENLLHGLGFETVTVR